MIVISGFTSQWWAPARGNFLPFLSAQVVESRCYLGRQFEQTKGYNLPFSPLQVHHSKVKACHLQRFKGYYSPICHPLTTMSLNMRLRVREQLIGTARHYSEERFELTGRSAKKNYQAEGCVPITNAFAWRILNADL